MAFVGRHANCLFKCPSEDKFGDWLLWLLLHPASSIAMAAEDNTSLPQPAQSSTPIIPRSYKHLKQLQESNTPLKMSWSGLEGLVAEEAKRRIKEEMPDIQIQVIQPDRCITFDYRLDRIRLYVDKSGKVMKTLDLAE